MGAKTQGGKMTEALVLEVFKKHPGVPMAYSRIKREVLQRAEAKGLPASVLREIYPQIKMLQKAPKPEEHGGTVTFIEGKPQQADGKCGTKNAYRFDPLPAAMLRPKGTGLQLAAEALARAATELEAARAQLARFGFTAVQPALPLEDDPEPLGHDGRPEAADA